MNYPKAEIENKTSNGYKVIVRDEDLIYMAEGTLLGLVELRTLGNLAQRAFYLSPDYNWIIVLDDKDETCLVPLKK